MPLVGVLVIAATVGGRILLRWPALRRPALLFGGMLAVLLLTTTWMPWFIASWHDLPVTTITGADLASGGPAASELYGPAAWFVGDCRWCADTTQFPVAGPAVPLLCGSTSGLAVLWLLVRPDGAAGARWARLGWSLAALTSTFAALWDLDVAFQLDWAVAKGAGLWWWIACSATMSTIALALRVPVQLTDAGRSGRTIALIALSSLAMIGAAYSRIFPFSSGVWGAIAAVSAIGAAAIGIGTAGGRGTWSEDPRAGWLIALCVAGLSGMGSLAQGGMTDFGDGRIALALGWGTPVATATAMVLCGCIVLAGRRTRPEGQRSCETSSPDQAGDAGPGPRRPTIGA